MELDLGIGAQLMGRCAQAFGTGRGRRSCSVLTSVWRLTPWAPRPPSLPLRPLPAFSYFLVSVLISSSRALVLPLSPSHLSKVPTVLIFLVTVPLGDRIHPPPASATTTSVPPRLQSPRVLTAFWLFLYHVAAGTFCLARLSARQTHSRVWSNFCHVLTAPGAVPMARVQV